MLYRGSKYGENLENSLAIKSNAVELLDRALFNRARKQQYGYIVFSSSTDSYLHFEEEEKLMRSLLSIFLKHKFPVHIITKSPLIVRDFDLLDEINNTEILPSDLKSHNLAGALINFSFSTLDDKVGRIEPCAPSLKLR